MSLAEDLNKRQKEELKTKDDYKEYVYVMVSTLNQMVNYIPLIHFDFDEVYNITITDSEQNKTWDKNLKNTLNSDISITPIGLTQSEILNITKIQNRLKEKLKDKKVFWNVTGGQRAFLLTINMLKKPEDIICYLEGNTNQMVLLKDDNVINQTNYNINSCENLNIEKALKLMGFEVKDTKTSHTNLLKICDEDEKKFYLEFLKIYEQDKDLREKLILLNKEDTKESAKKEISSKLQHLNYKKLNEELDKNKAFGYILEKLAGYKILEVAKEKIIDLAFSLKINFDENKKENEQHIDEFDIALLTKNGKFLIFECKSGAMSSDVAKSTNYSTYAVSGVYGKPILITPLLKNDILNLNDLDKNHCYIKSALRAATRASLEVWGLDNIENKLQEYIK